MVSAIQSSRREIGGADGGTLKGLAVGDGVTSTDGVTEGEAVGVALVLGLGVSSGGDGVVEAAGVQPNTSATASIRTAPGARAARRCIRTEQDSRCPGSAPESRSRRVSR
jgi:hypothetical protein